MKSLLNESAHKELISRLDNFSYDKQPLWGKMIESHCHLEDRHGDFQIDP